MSIKFLFIISWSVFHPDEYYFRNVSEGGRDILLLMLEHIGINFYYYYIVWSSGWIIVGKGKFFNFVVEKFHKP